MNITDRHLRVGIAVAGAVVFLLFGAYGLGIFSGSFNFFESEKPVEEMRFSWVRASSSIPWEPRDAHALVVHNEELILLGGINGNPAVTGSTTVAYWNAPHFADIWRSGDGKDWQKSTTSVPFTPRRSVSVNSFNNALYTFGGWSPISGYTTGIWRSKNGFRWEQITGVPAFGEREGQIVTEYKERLWLFGGVNFDERKTFNDVWVSSDGANWTRVASSSPWTPRYDHDVVVHENTLWLLGGLYLGGEGIGDVWKSDDGKHWEKIATTTPWGPRHGHTALVHDGYIWVISGWDTENDRGYRDTWYSADGRDWKRASRNAAPWLGREDHAAVIFNDTLWFTGGMGTGLKWLNDVWYADMYMPDISNAVQ